LPSVEAEDDKSRGRMPPIKVNFEIPYFTVSGIQVRSRGMYKAICPM
jgi:AP-1 complex subunit mu